MTATRISRGDQRFYPCPDGIERVSVTTVLDGVIAKPGLIIWAANTEREFILDQAAALYGELQAVSQLSPAGYWSTLKRRLGPLAHKQHSKAAADIGTSVHKMVEWTLRTEQGMGVGEAPPLTDQGQRSFDHWRRWRDMVKLEPQFLEQQVYSVRHGYAGTLDYLGIATLPDVGRVWVIADWKTGRLYPPAKLQAAAYLHAADEMEHCDAKQTYSIIARLPKDSEFDAARDIQILPPDEAGARFNMFLNCLSLWRWLQEEDAYRKGKKCTLIGIPDEAEDPLMIGAFE